MKNPATQRHRGPYCLYAPKVIVVTATPQMNKTVDLLGYLNLFWDPNWALPENCQPSPDLTPSSSYEQRFHDAIAQKYPDYWASMGRMPLYILDPARFARMANKGHFTSKTAMVVLRSINSLLMLRRTMATKIPIHEVLWLMIGSEVMPYRIAAPEIGWGSAALLERHMEAYEKYIHCLNIPGAGGTGGENLRRPSEDPSGLRNARVHRQLCMIANDPRYDEVVYRCPVSSQSSTETEELMPASEQYRMLASEDCGGTEWLSYAKSLPLDPVPVDRPGKAQALASGEPKLLYVCKLL